MRVYLHGGRRPWGLWLVVGVVGLLVVTVFTLAVLPRKVTIAGRRYLAVCWAVSTAEQQRGLMGRKLQPREACVFDWSKAGPVRISFWMRNTPGPLAAVWMLYGRVVGVTVMPACGAVCPTYPSPGLVDRVVEVRPQDLPPGVRS